LDYLSPVIRCKPEIGIMTLPFESVPEHLIAIVGTRHCACFAFTTDVLVERNRSVEPVVDFANMESFAQTTRAGFSAAREDLRLRKRSNGQRLRDLPMCAQQVWKYAGVAVVAHGP
jgi:hypothetical protein